MHVDRETGVSFGELGGQRLKSLLTASDHDQALRSAGQLPRERIADARGGPRDEDRSV